MKGTAIQRMFQQVVTLAFMICRLWRQVLGGEAASASAGAALADDTTSVNNNERGESAEPSVSVASVPSVKAAKMRYEREAARLRSEREAAATGGLRRLRKPSGTVTRFRCFERLSEAMASREALGLACRNSPDLCRPPDAMMSTVKM